MTLRWLRRGIGAGGRAAALLALAQCGVTFDSDPFGEEGGEAAAESETDDDDDDDDDDDESAGSTSDADAESGTTRSSSTSGTGAEATSSSSTATTTTVGSSTSFSDGTSTSSSTTGWTSTTATSDVSGTTLSADDTAGTTTTSGPGETLDPDPTGDQPVELDCDAPMPSSGAQQRSGNGVGGDGNLAWEIWSNTGRGELVTYDVPAFSAIWNEAGGYLGRLGYEWGGFGDNPVPHEQLGEITAQFASRKMDSSTGGTYSYIGMYGWSSNPCVEWYVIDDSFNTMPVVTGSPQEPTNDEGTVDLDGGTYIIRTRTTVGTGGSRCSGASTWLQIYSVRTTARTCGQISLSEHFEAWENVGLMLGNLLEAKILVEVGGGQGRVDLPIANVMLNP